MKKEEIYVDVLSLVVEVTGINEHELLHSKIEECADARYLLVKALSLMLTGSDICKMIGITRQGVSFIRRNDKKPMKWSVARNWKEIRKYVESNYFL